MGYAFAVGVVPVDSHNVAVRENTKCLGNSLRYDRGEDVWLDDKA
jgi:hypothetical protein